MKAGVNAKVVEAFDINDKANDVYEYNFGHRPYQVWALSSLFCSAVEFWMRWHLSSCKFEFCGDFLI